MSAHGPVASVVIPAHNEAAVLGRLLEALKTGLDGHQLEIVVACNGCTDDTAGVARAHGATVVEIAAASKIDALNAADDVAVTFPRCYIDADVVVAGSAVVDVARSLRAPVARGAAPPMRVNVQGRPWSVRAFYRVWEHTGYLRSGHIGSGFYAMSLEGRRRFECFPHVVADDEFARGTFARNERIVVPTVPFVVEAPMTVDSLVRRRTRVYAGNLELAADHARRSLPGADESETPWWKAVAVQPRLWLSAVPYIALNFVAKRRARRVMRDRSPIEWGRDETTRVQPIDSGSLR